MNLSKARDNSTWAVSWLAELTVTPFSSPSFPSLSLVCPSQKPPCVDSKCPSVYRHHAHIKDVVFVWWSIVVSVYADGDYLACLNPGIQLRVGVFPVAAWGSRVYIKCECALCNLATVIEKVQRNLTELQGGTVLSSDRFTQTSQY